MTSAVFVTKKRKYYLRVVEILHVNHLFHLSDSLEYYLNMTFREKSYIKKFVRKKQ